MPSRSRPARLALLSSMALLCASEAFARQRPSGAVDLTAPDGLTLKATYFAAAAPGPGVLLLHQCNRQRKVWDALAQDLSAAGIHVLTVDYRGYGESAGERFESLPQAEAARIQQEKWPGDIDAAFAYLVAQPGVKKDTIGVGGASCGVQNSVQTARRHPEVKSLVLLSGATDLNGRTFLRTAQIPVFFSVADDDEFPPTVVTMQWLYSLTGTAQKTLARFATGGHGSDMFAVQKQLPKQIADWYVQTLIKTPGRAAATRDHPRIDAEADIVNTIDQPGGAATVTRKLEDARKRDPKAQLFPEDLVNFVGYEHLQSGDIKGAIAIMQLNARAYPTSANVFDSLGDAYLADGQTDLARENAEKALALLKSDTSIDDARRAAIRASAEAKLKRIVREWPDYAGGPDSSRFVAATQISKQNVAQLQVAWTYPDGDTDFNPLFVGDVVYTRARGGKLAAIDAATGASRWTTAEIEGFGVRGINYWESADGKDRRLLLTAQNMLRAFDASTGQPIRSFGKDGAVDLREGLDRDPKTVEQQSRLPGKIFDNLIILGSATNQEYASAPGDIRAFDVRTGAHVWSFRTIPRKGEFGANTWPEGARAHVGGANAWAEMSVDAARGIVYVPTGSAKHNFFGGYRRGDNLFSDSLLALDARTGTRLWHFQTVHHDIWDLDNNSAPQLTTITHDGKNIDIVAAASKTGYLYVFDRVSGKPIWPIEERPVPQTSTVPGQYLSPTQPIPTKPEPFSRQSFTVDDLNPYLLTDEQRAQFRERLRKARNDGPFTPIGFDEVVHMPGNQGGSNWGSTASSPDGRVYVIGFNVPTIIRLLKPGETRPARAGYAEETVKEGYPTTDGFGLYPTIVKPPYTTLTAYDLNTGAIAWQKGLGDDLRLLPLGITGTGSAMTVKGGLIVTGSGLVFATAADRKVHVYDTSNGSELATLPLGGPTSGGPSMYEHGGRQYLLVTASPVQPSGPGAVPTPHKGPTGLIAYALPR